MSVLNGLLGLLWRGFAPAKPPQLPEDMCRIWAYAKPAINVPPGRVILAEYDNQTGFFTLTRMQIKEDALCALPKPDTPEGGHTPSFVLAMMGELARLPENVAPVTKPNNAQHVKDCCQELERILGHRREAQMHLVP